ncbi:hypothetical protein D3C79_1014290 [compost metagenome]
MHPATDPVLSADHICPQTRAESCCRPLAPDLFAQLLAAALHDFETCGHAGHCKRIGIWLETCPCESIAAFHILKCSRYSLF